MIPLAQASASQGVDWPTLVATVVSILTGLIGLGAWAKRTFTKAVSSAVAMPDGRSVVQMLESNSKTLTDLHADFARLAEDVREIRTQHSGLESRISHLEQQAFGRRGRW